MKSSIVRPERVAPGAVIYDDLLLDPDRPLCEQLDDLKEDLLLVEFAGPTFLAVGWCPSLKPGGSFLIELSDDAIAWNTIFERRCQTLEDLGTCLDEAVTEAKRQAARPGGAARPW